MGFDYSTCDAEWAGTVAEHAEAGNSVSKKPLVLRTLPLQ